MEESVNYVINYMNEAGPFDGIVGFSFGATLALTIMNRSKLGIETVELVSEPSFIVVFSGTNRLEQHNYF
jgi:hypothetical protein